MENTRKIHRMRKKKIKLNAEQKKILKHLEHYTKHFINWAGEQDLREAASDGHIAVFSRRGDCPYSDDYFDFVIMTDDVEGAYAILKWNTPTHGLIVDLKWFDVLKEVKNSWKPGNSLPDNLDE